MIYVNLNHFFIPCDVYFLCCVNYFLLFITNDFGDDAMMPLRSSWHERKIFNKVSQELQQHKSEVADNKIKEWKKNSFKKIVSFKKRLLLFVFRRNNIIVYKIEKFFVSYCKEKRFFSSLQDFNVSIRNATLDFVGRVDAICHRNSVNNK